MKLKVSIALSGGGTHDVSLVSDVTTTVSDAARDLIRAGITGDPELESIARDRLFPVTLRVWPSPSSPPIILDPCSPLGTSGLQSGWLVQPVREFAPHASGDRMIDVAGYLEVLEGAQTGAQFSLIAGENMIGRDQGSSRVLLLDPSVSRRHALITVTETLTIKDLGSANGTWVDQTPDQPITQLEIQHTATLRVGGVPVRVTVGPKPQGHARQPLSHQTSHTRAPRIDPHFVGEGIELPTPPSRSSPRRIPMLAMLAPMLLGGAMFALTRSPLSLMMVAFSPLMLIGSWLDQHVGRERRLKRETEKFRDTLREDQEQIARQWSNEVLIRGQETPTVQAVAEAIRARDRLLWAKRPEHRTFLEVRLGEGVLPSRTHISLPKRSDTEAEQWAELVRFRDAYTNVSPVPIVERLDRCGNIGIAGPAPWAEAHTRALILQLVGLHSPTELVFASFATVQQDTEWSWLKWLPHVDSVGSPLPVWQIADDVPSSLRLVMALEGLLESRRGNHRSGTARLRSHLEEVSRNDAHHDEEVSILPYLPIVVVLVLATSEVDASRLIALAEDGPDFGIHMLWVARSVSQLPAACRTYTEMDKAIGSVGFVRNGLEMRLQRTEMVDIPVMRDHARLLAPVEDRATRVLDESDLPSSVNLRELHRIDLLGGAVAIAQAWGATGSLIGSWNLGEERAETPLRAVVGQSTTGPALIDLRAHGPHALVGGTTGAGKSEFLQSWIMSLAAEVSPERLTFLLVDYKGGAAFAECVDLPHTVGLVTDLSPHLVARALTSLRAELRYREELLAEHGAKDLATMERRSDAHAPPTLVIVIDEFAALAGEVPEFVDGVIDVAQRGRSLGLHLIMATQRPAGVIKDNLRANTNLRIALRMADESDSNDVIGLSDAAHFDAETPGRGAIKIGPGRITHFQAGYLGGRVGQTVDRTPIEIRSLGFTEGDVWNISSERPSTASPRRRAPRDIERLRDGIRQAAIDLGTRVPRRPWLNELPEILPLKNLNAMHAGHLARERGRHEMKVGLRDIPSAQSQVAAAIDFDAVGNLAFIGAGGTGKTSALHTISMSLSEEAADCPVEIYGIDAGGGALGAIAVLPTVSAIATLADAELCGRVLSRLRQIVAERSDRFAAARASDLATFRAIAGNEREPRVVLAIDGFAAFRQSVEMLAGATAPLVTLAEIMTSGRAVGVHVVITSDRPGALPTSLASSVQQQFVFRLANPSEYGALGIKSDALIDAPAGRAVDTVTKTDVQIAIPGSEPNLMSSAAALEALGTRLRDHGVAQVAQVRNAPTMVPLESLPSAVGDRAVIGIDAETFEPIGAASAGLAVIAGPPGSGQTTAARTIVRSMRRFAEATGRALDTAVLSFVPGSLDRGESWTEQAIGATEVAALAQRLTVALGGQLPEKHGMLLAGIGKIEPQIPRTFKPRDSSRPENPRGSFTFGGEGRLGVVVVERPAEADGTDAVLALAALAKAARRSRALVVFECEQGALNQVWDLFSALKQPTWGIALQPDATETQTPFRESFGRVKRTDFPAGRGLFIEHGWLRQLQIATTGAEGASQAPSSMIDQVDQAA